MEKNIIFGVGRHKFIFLGPRNPHPRKAQGRKMPRQMKFNLALKGKLGRVFQKNLLQRISINELILNLTHQDLKPNQTESKIPFDVA